MDKPFKSSETASRRQFLQQGIHGAAAFGLGGVASLIPSQASAAEKPAAPAGDPKLGKEFSYDLAKFRQTDAKLIQFEETGRLAVNSKKLKAIVVGGEDRIYLAAENAVLVLDKNGALVREIRLETQPGALAVAGDGTVYVGLQDHVEVFDPAGLRKAQWESAGRSAIFTSLAVTEKDLFVADAGNRVVRRYDLTGKQVSLIGQKDRAKQIPGFIVPGPYFELTVSRDGQLWVVNPGRHRIEAYTFDGNLERTWGEPTFGIEGFCGCCNPIHFALMPDGRFVTAEKGFVRVKIYSPKGEFECVVAGAESFAPYAENPNKAGAAISVAVDSQGRVLVADPLAGAVRIFARRPAAKGPERS